jgi:hypothetical protein
MANIFNIDWGNVGENLIPWFWRRTKSGGEANIVAYVRSMLAPIQSMGDELNQFRDDTLDFLNYDGQHKVLEEYLNDLYDITFRRIFITENNIAAIDEVNMYQTEEANPSPLSFYQTGEVVVAPIAFYQAGEGVTAANFTVNIPTSIVYDEVVITAQLRNYVEASKNFNFVTF